MEKRRRSVLKAVTWRIIAIFVLGIVSYLFTSDLTTMGLITGSFNAIQMVLYYFHERGWGKISWGLRNQPSSE